MSQPLNTAANIDRPDDFYEALIDMHRNLSADESQMVNARLILLLANHIGAADVLQQAMHLARDGATAPA